MSKLAHSNQKTMDGIDRQRAISDGNEDLLEGAGFTDAQVEMVDDGHCSFAYSGRGDCSHAVGLPGESIPDQHDGPDDTVDHYGKPNGWCWQCWKSHQIEHQQMAVTAALRKLKDATPSKRNGPCVQAINILREQLGHPPMKPGGCATDNIDRSLEADHA